MRRKRGGCILIALGAVLALAAGIIVFVTVSTSTDRPAEVPKTSVVVAAVDIPERTLVQASMLKVVSYPNDLLPKNYRTRPEEVIGRYSLQKLFPGQALVSEQLADTKGASGMSFVLGKGNVLVAVNYAGAGNILSTGFIKTGDYVDLVINVVTATGPEIATTMRNVKVFSVGGGSQAAQKQGASTMLLFEVPPQDALILKFHEQLGTDLLLRAAADEEIPALEPVTIQYLVNKYGIIPPATKQN